MKPTWRWRSVLVLAGILLTSLTAVAEAHPLDPSLLQLTEHAGGRVSVLWSTPATAPGGIILSPQLPAACAPLDTRSTRLAADARRLVTTWRVDCGASGLAGAEIRIAGLAAGGTDALLRIVRPDGGVLQAVLRPTAPVFVVAERQGVVAVAYDYAALGFEHILRGLDHLLFVLGLLLLIEGRRRLLGTITAFTLGHSLTLALSVLGQLRIEPRLAEALIAGSILLLAVEMVVSSPSRPGFTRRSPWIVAGGFGLVHGLGFAGALVEVGLPLANLPLALASFNVGIEVGQIAFVVVTVSFLRALRLVSEPRRLSSARFAAYPIGVLATFWVLDRVSALL